ncbi:hypothetical protein JAAARDRAFT_195857 [Jaapia argillacea MUCL 33604]|uniref:Uncharacterized protein n=1 Tax=Jaapia argillacea MUCL 33604 TaxID=933084 RepID=A0A067PW44_9AGAM|nr:hypothetical protein JAAARDRAFT_195857 [Jaapia argillacea MUCL 33604]
MSNIYNDYFSQLPASSQSSYPSFSPSQLLNATSTVTENRPNNLSQPTTLPIGSSSGSDALAELTHWQQAEKNRPPSPEWFVKMMADLSPRDRQFLDEGELPEVNPFNGGSVPATVRSRSPRFRGDMPVSSFEPVLSNAVAQVRWSSSPENFQPPFSEPLPAPFNPMLTAGPPVLFTSDHLRLSADILSTLGRTLNRPAPPPYMGAASSSVAGYSVDENAGPMAYPSYHPQPNLMYHADPSIAYPPPYPPANYLQAPPYFNPQPTPAASHSVNPRKRQREGEAEYDPRPSKHVELANPDTDVWNDATFDSQQAGPSSLTPSGSSSSSPNASSPADTQSPPAGTPVGGKNVGKIRCQIGGCDRELVPSSMAKHVRNVHDHLNRWTCPICQKRKAENRDRHTEACLKRKRREDERNLAKAQRNSGV